MTREDLVDCFIDFEFKYHIGDNSDSTIKQQVVDGVEKWVNLNKADND
jgi:hypothetical protein